MTSFHVPQDLLYPGILQVVNVTQCSHVQPTVSTLELDTTNGTQATSEYKQWITMNIMQFSSAHTVLSAASSIVSQMENIL